MAAIVENPFVRGHATRMRLAVPTAIQRVWSLIATPRGLQKWFPVTCKGRVSPGKTLEFGWPDGSTEEFQVLNLKRGHFWSMSWSNGGKVRYHVSDGEPVIFQLEVKYPQGRRGMASLSLEQPLWASVLMNLKSVALKGPDLRTNNPRLSWKKAFID